MDMNDMDDIKELKGVMETLNETVPSLISGIVKAVYNAEDSEKLAQSTAQFYKELVDAGMDKEHAYKLTRDFMKGRDVSSLIREALSSTDIFGGDFDDDMGKEIENKVRKKMKEKMKEDWE
ncbi:MAG: hypothetical protein R6U17_06280 [Thermoplasmata archaeon]